MDTAYLVAHVDPHAPGLPVVVMCAIYSESARQLTIEMGRRRNWCPVDVLHAIDVDFESAVNAVRAECARGPYGWALEMVDEEDRRLGRPPRTLVAQTTTKAGPGTFARQQASSARWTSRVMCPACGTEQSGGSPRVMDDGRVLCNRTSDDGQSYSCAGVVFTIKDDGRLFHFSLPGRKQ